MDNIIFGYDLETTGVNVKKHSIHQIAGYIERNNIIIEEFNFEVRPNPKAKIDSKALATCNVTEEQILAYPEMVIVYRQLTKLLAKYVNKFDKTDKMHLLGFNNHNFDDVFLRAWFVQNKDEFFGSWFWPDSLDAMVFASQYLLDRRHQMPSFKLHRVCKELGIQVDGSRLHDAMYDIYLTRQVYRVTTGLDIEL